jgi:hypothetical protein
MTFAKRLPKVRNQLEVDVAFDRLIATVQCMLCRGGSVKRLTKIQMLIKLGKPLMPSKKKEILRHFLARNRL